MDNSTDELLNNLSWQELKEKNKIEAILILQDINKIISSVNTFNLLTQLTKMSFYIREDEDVYEYSIAYNLRELPIIHLLCGLSLQMSEWEVKPDISAENLFTLINKSISYLLKDSPYLSVTDEEEKNKSFVIQGHRQTMKMIRPLNPERYHHQTESFVNYIDNRVSDMFINKFGLSPKDFLTIGKLINEYTINKINNNRRLSHMNSVVVQFLNNPEADTDFTKVIISKNEEDSQKYFDFYVRYLDSLYTYKDLQFTIDELIQDASFKYVESDKIEKYLNTYSSKQGDQLINSDVLIDSVLIYKPFISWNRKYFCPAPTDVISSLPAFFEKILEDEKLASPPTRVWDRYQKAKAYFVEDKAEEYFLRIFPKASVHKNVIYNFNGNIEEIDLLIPYDNKLIIVQAKSGSLNYAARRGAEKSFKNAIKKLVEDSYYQGVRVRDYIETNPDTSFRLQMNNELVFQSNTEIHKLTDYIFISLTLESLGILSARIKELRFLGLFKSNEYPLAMSIYDLDTITSILPASPSILLHYIKQRISSQNEGLFVFHDELTPFGWYLEMGCIKKPSDPEYEDITHISIDTDYLTKFDEHYLKKGDKPKLIVEDEWVSLIMHIEKIGTPGFSEITEQLLNISSEMRKRLIKRIQETYSKKYKKEIIGITSLGSTLEPLGVTFVTYDTTTATLNQILETYSLLRKYQAKKRYWIGLAKQQKSNGSWWETTCVQYYNFPWVFDINYNNEPNTFSNNN
ncbi:hypothetical protein GCM10028808_39190 [Spirosoma migulaei]